MSRTLIKHIWRLEQNHFEYTIILWIICVIPKFRWIWWKTATTTTTTTSNNIERYFLRNCPKKDNSTRTIHVCMISTEINDNRGCLCVKPIQISCMISYLKHFHIEKWSSFPCYKYQKGVVDMYCISQHRSCRRRRCCCCCCSYCFLSLFCFIHQIYTIVIDSQKYCTVSYQFFLLSACLSIYQAIIHSLHISHIWMDVQFVHGTHETSNLSNPINRLIVSHHMCVSACTCVFHVVCMCVRACILLCRRFVRRSKLSSFNFISFFSHSKSIKPIIYVVFSLLEFFLLK